MAKPCAWVRTDRSESLLGDKRAAIRWADEAVALSAEDRFSGPNSEEALAEVYAWVGEPDEAIDRIEQLLSINYQNALTVAELRIDPRWIPLREHPRFKKLVE